MNLRRAGLLKAKVAADFHLNTRYVTVTVMGCSFLVLVAISTVLVTESSLQLCLQRQHLADESVVKRVIGAPECCCTQLKFYAFAEIQF